MPSHDVHNKYDMQVFNCAPGQFDWVHKLIDGPFPKMFGKEHRKILHDPEGVEAIRQLVTSMYGPFIGNMAATVAMHHISLDYPRTYFIQDGRLVKHKRVHKPHKKHTRRKNP